MMFTPYPNSHNNRWHGILGVNLARYRIPLFCLLAICIVTFAIFGLSNEEMYTEISEDKAKTYIPNKMGILQEESFTGPDTSEMKQSIENLIILPCHAIFAPELNQHVVDHQGADKYAIAKDPNNWLMEPFQLESDDHLSFFKHIELSLRELHENIPNSALVISGGFTKSSIEKSESSSYLELAQTVGLLKNPYFKINTNIFIGEYARDSYENVLYSLCTFYKKFKKFPRKITIVGFDFKRERFLSSHLTTLGYYMLPTINNDEISLKSLPNTKHVKYVGAGPFIPSKKADLTEEEYEAFKDEFWSLLYKNEQINALDPFKSNPFGSKDSILHDKKLKRDPWDKHDEVYNYYQTDSDILNSLLEIDKYDIRNAWNIYQKKVLPEFPLYDQ